MAEERCGIFAWRDGDDTEPPVYQAVHWLIHRWLLSISIGCGSSPYSGKSSMVMNRFAIQMMKFMGIPMRAKSEKR